MAPMHIRITAEELQLDNQESVKLTEGGGYLGWLGVFHKLHCIVCIPNSSHEIAGEIPLTDRAEYAAALALS